MGKLKAGKAAGQSGVIAEMFRSYIETVLDFCYLGDVTKNTGGCVDAVTAKIKSAWTNFRELLPLLNNRAIFPQH